MQKGAPLATNEIKQSIISAYQNLAPEQKLSNEQILSSQVDQFVNEELAIRAAVDQDVEREISHRLEPLAAFFPPNPRQIKRVINAVTMYHAVALQQNGLDASDPRWFQLVLWIILLTEWPETWRLLASYPKIVDLLNVADPKTSISNIEPADLPGSQDATLKEVKRIRDDKVLMALITGASDREGPVLDRMAIEELLTLTPVYGRKAGLKKSRDEEAEETMNGASTM
jgi:hypothetical protein